MPNFTNKHVCVVGSARGIGLALVTQLAAEGSNTVLAVDTYLSPELKDLSDKNRNVTYAKADVCQPDELAAAATSIPQVDLFFCVAGVLGSQQPLLSRDDTQPKPLDDLQKVFSINVFGTWNAVEAFQSKLADGAKVLLMSSSNGSLETATKYGNPAYSMSKAAVNMLGRKLSVELAPRGIDVVLMSPGVVITQMNNWGGEITPEQSVKGILEQLEKPDINGKFLRYDGNGWPW